MYISKFPKRYKRNTTSGDLHRYKKIQLVLALRSEQSQQNTTKLDIHDSLSKMSFEISLHL